MKKNLNKDDNTYVLRYHEFYILKDSGGEDTIDVSPWGPTVINLQAGSYSKQYWEGWGFQIAQGVTIENVRGGDGSDWIYDNAADNKIWAGGQSDYIYLSGGNDTVDGGDGGDTVYYTAAFSEFKVTKTSDGALQLSHALLGNDSFTNVERFSFNGASYTLADLYKIATLAPAFSAGQGNNNGNSGSNGGEVNNGNSSGQNNQPGTNDTYTAKHGQKFVINDAGGEDTIDTSALAPAIIRMGAGEFSTNYWDSKTGFQIAEGVTIENVRAGWGSDWIHDNNVDNKVWAGEGQDWIFMTGGNDTVDGGAGKDTAIYFVPLSEFKIRNVDSSTVELSHARFGKDTFTNVELFAFIGDKLSFQQLQKLAGLGWKGCDSEDEEQDDSGKNDGQDKEHDDNGNHNGQDKEHDDNGNHYGQDKNGNNGQKHDDHDDLLRERQFTRVGKKGGDSDDSLSGGKDDDLLEGGNGKDKLNGGNGHDKLDGGKGGDTMSGGQGDDTYVVDDANDVVSEGKKDTGKDEVDSCVSFFLAVGIEDLTLTGSDDINGTGNKTDNTLLGNCGNNVLSGGDGNDYLRGCCGNDTLIGGKGKDRFVIDSLDGTDTVVDYVKGQDVLDLSDIISGFDFINFNQWVRFDVVGKDTRVMVDPDAIEGNDYGWQHVATLNNVQMSYGDIVTGWAASTIVFI